MSQENTESNNPKIGHDEWVAQVASRQAQAYPLMRWWHALPGYGQWLMGLLGLALFLLVPIITANPLLLASFNLSNNNFILLTLNRFLIFAMLAIGLNVVVGYAGLLDLGYVAFYGLAGYFYAYLASNFVTAFSPNGIHLPSLVVIILIVAGVSLIGYLLGALSLRLSGDYLAIVTLGFGQVFTLLALSATGFICPVGIERLILPNFQWHQRSRSLKLFGLSLNENWHYFYFFSLMLLLIYIMVYRINHSRIGRAWRAIRDDELAAEVMGTPTGHLKLLAFAWVLASLPLLGCLMRLGRAMWFPCLATAFLPSSTSMP
ncbi:MAG: branched-chain amino acid ABC transporter permease [Deinococcales bacterium]